MDSDNKILLIIDPQVDFIAGSLTVEGAAGTMDALAGYIRMNGRQYDLIIVTADRHPIDHCSFKRNGGLWPTHCVADSVGAAIWPSVMEALIERGEGVIVLHKGQNRDCEEYSIFKNKASAERIAEIVSDDHISKIDICGLAGDYCVADSIRDGIAIFGPQIFRVLPDFIASIDGGATLSEIIAKFKLPCTR